MWARVGAVLALAAVAAISGIVALSIGRARPNPAPATEPIPLLDPVDAWARAAGYLDPGSADAIDVLDFADDPNEGVVIVGPDDSRYANVRGVWIGARPAVDGEPAGWGRTGIRAGTFEADGETLRFRRDPDAPEATAAWADGVLAALPGIAPDGGGGWIVTDQAELLGAMWIPLPGGSFIPVGGNGLPVLIQDELDQFGYVVYGDGHVWVADDEAVALVIAGDGAGGLVGGGPEPLILGTLLEDESGLRFDPVGEPDEEQWQVIRDALDWLHDAALGQLEWGSRVGGTGASDPAMIPRSGSVMAPGPWFEQVSGSLVALPADPGRSGELYVEGWQPIGPLSGSVWYSEPDGLQRTNRPFPGKWGTYVTGREPRPATVEAESPGIVCFETPNEGPGPDAFVPPQAVVEYSGREPTDPIARSRLELARAWMPYVELSEGERCGEILRIVAKVFPYDAANNPVEDLGDAERVAITYTIFFRDDGGALFPWADAPEWVYWAFWPYTELLPDRMGQHEGDNEGFTIGLVRTVETAGRCGLTDPPFAFHSARSSGHMDITMGMVLDAVNSFEITPGQALATSWAGGLYLYAIQRATDHLAQKPVVAGTSLQMDWLTERFTDDLTSDQLRGRGGSGTCPAVPVGLPVTADGQPLLGPGTVGDATYKILVSRDKHGVYFHRASCEAQLVNWAEMLRWMATGFALDDIAVDLVRRLANELPDWAKPPGWVEDAADLTVDVAKKSVTCVLFLGCVPYVGDVVDDAWNELRDLAERPFDEVAEAAGIEACVAGRELYDLSPWVELWREGEECDCSDNTASCRVPGWPQPYETLWHSGEQKPFYCLARGEVFPDDNPYQLGSDFFSFGAQIAVVPDLDGLTVSAALAALAEADLEGDYGTEPTINPLDDGRVVGQDVPAFTELPPKSFVMFWVGAYVAPEVGTPTTTSTSTTTTSTSTTTTSTSTTSTTTTTTTTMAIDTTPPSLSWDVWPDPLEIWEDGCVTEQFREYQVSLGAAASDPSGIADVYATWTMGIASGTIPFVPSGGYWGAEFGPFDRDAVAYPGKDFYIRIHAVDGAGNTASSSLISGYLKSCDM